MPASRAKAGLDAEQWTPEIDTSNRESRSAAAIPGARIRYLAEIAEQGRAINGRIDSQAELASRLQHLYEALKLIEDPELPGLFTRLSHRVHAMIAAIEACSCCGSATRRHCQICRQSRYDCCRNGRRKAGVQSEKLQLYRARHGDYRQQLSRKPESPEDPQDRCAELQRLGRAAEFPVQENLPGAYPYTGGVYPYRRLGEDPTRMFAGEGTPERTNRRFHYLSQGQPQRRLSTAFDSVTLYGEDPHERPDIYGKVGNSGVSIATVDDMKKLYSGFDLCAPTPRCR